MEKIDEIIRRAHLIGLNLVGAGARRERELELAFLVRDLAKEVRQLRQELRQGWTPLLDEDENG